MNAPKALLALALLVFLAFTSGFDLIFRLAYAVGLVLILGFYWTRSNLRGLFLRRESKGTRWQVGQILEERFTIANRSILPKIWLELRDESTLPGHQGSTVVTIPGKDTRSWVVRTECQIRGRYTLGPLTISSTDPFGLFVRQGTVLDTRQIIVYPKVVPLPHLSIPAGELPGGNITRERSLSISPSAAGVREYAPGDGLNRIHWLSTARTGRLMSKEFEKDPTSNVWIVLDLESRVQLGKGQDGTEEWAVMTAASLASHFLQQNRAVGLIAQGSDRCFIHSDRGTRQQIKILEELAVVRATGRTSLGEILAKESVQLSRSDTVLVVTPSTEEWWLDSLRLLLHRGVRAAAFLLESSTFGGTDGSLLLVSSLAAAQVPTFLVKRGEPLEQSLAGEGHHVAVAAGFSLRQSPNKDATAGSSLRGEQGKES